VRLDFDGDQFLGTDDLEQTLKLLTRDELVPDEVSLVSSKVTSLYSRSSYSTIIMRREIANKHTTKNFLSRKIKSSIRLLRKKGIDISDITGFAL